MLTFDRKYFFFAVGLFIIEVFIALYLHDKIVRPYVGDFLVVFLIYCAVRAFLCAPALKVAIGVLLFSYLIEVLQYFKLVKLLGFQHNAVAKAVLGNGFDWIDLLLYTLGIIMVLVLEKVKRQESLFRTVSRILPLHRSSSAP